MTFAEAEPVRPTDTVTCSLQLNSSLFSLPWLSPPWERTLLFTFRISWMSPHLPSYLSQRGGLSEALPQFPAPCPASCPC